MSRTIRTYELVDREGNTWLVDVWRDATGAVCVDDEGGELPARLVDLAAECFLRDETEARHEAEQRDDGETTAGGSTGTASSLS
jgi:hypothetical protein